MLVSFKLENKAVREKMLAEKERDAIDYRIESQREEILCTQMHQY